MVDDEWASAEVWMRRFSRNQRFGCLDAATTAWLVASSEPEWGATTLGSAADGGGHPQRLDSTPDHERLSTKARRVPPPQE
jgi:hypothetical protein